MYWQRSAIPQNLLLTTLAPLAGMPVGRTIMGLPPRGPDYPYAAMSRPSYLVVALPLTPPPPGAQSFALPPAYFNGLWG